jgi:very-short-patch-repair endonuclease
MQESGMGTTQIPFKRRHAFCLLKLRQNPTPAEHEFRCRLDALGQDYRFQQAFYHPVYRIADFYIPSLNLIVEIDGPCHDPAADRDRDEAFEQARGIKTVRLTNAQVFTGDFRVLDTYLRS